MIKKTDRKRFRKSMFNGFSDLASKTKNGQLDALVLFVLILKHKLTYKIKQFFTTNTEGSHLAANEFADYEGDS